MNYSIVDHRKNGLIELDRVRTMEEALDGVKKWVKILPYAIIDILETKEPVYSKTEFEDWHEQDHARRMRDHRSS